MTSKLTRARPPQGGRVYCLVHYLQLVVMVASIVGVILTSGCSHGMSQKVQPTRDINAVLAAHDKELLAIPGVVGVYVGLLRDGKSACLKVMLARKDEQLAQKIPRALEGYPVVTEVTGEIRPLK